jgi:putative heme iron utilization protein
MEGERIMASADDTADQPFWIARRLLRAARAATLGTVIDGQPFATLVTPASAPDLSVLLMLSSLSEHTRHLRADPRCSLLVVGTPESANPQTAPRVTLTGLAAPDPDPPLKARWLAVHPYGALYADFGDFAVWRIRPVQALFVGGFARASRLRQTELVPDPAAVAAIEAASAEIMAHWNIDHGAALEAIARHATGAASGAGWRMVGVDVDGCDLGHDELVIRVAWSGPVAGPDAVRAELDRLASAAV